MQSDAPPVSLAILNLTSRKAVIVPLSRYDNEVISRLNF